MTGRPRIVDPEVVLGALAEGQMPKQIAYEHGWRPDAVRMVLKRYRLKVGALTTTQAVVIHDRGRR